MIITNLIGGLGNQMFQYACARALALDQRQPLKVVLDMFDGYRLHNGPELSRVFDLDVSVAQREELRRLLGRSRATRPARRLLARPALQPLRGRHYVAEPSFRYWDGLRALDAGSDAYLHGYWQSERYFAAHAAAIRADFRFRRDAVGRNAELTREILGSAAISVHVRRGDYVRNPKTLAAHGTCSPEYYFDAIASLQQRVPEARFFAFSDAPSWVAETLGPRCPGLTVVDHNSGDESYNDMRLMSLCRHHIIANSSFSWWGAWLNSQQDKIVIAPRRWFANGTDDTDLIPAAWERR